MLQTDGLGGWGAMVELPRVLRLLWELEEPARPGPKPALRIRDIGVAAVKLADTAGLGAVSMSKLAAELGFTTMSLYRYVDSKDDVYVVMLDEAFGLPPELDPAAEWRARIIVWAEAFRDAIRRHPWVLQVPITEPPLSPNQLEWMEAGLRSFDGTGLTPNERLSSMLLVNIYVRGAMQVTVGARGNTPEAREADRRYVQRLTALADPDRFPTIATGLIDRPAEDFDIDYNADDFTLGLDTVLDGIQSLILRGEPND